MTDNSINLGPNEYPFYTEDSTMNRQEYAPIYSQNSFVNKINSYRVSRVSAPQPNTIVPLGTNGKFPASVITGVPVDTILSRDGLHTYRLVVEDNGALSVDFVS